MKALTPARKLAAAMAVASALVSTPAAAQLCSIYSTSVCPPTVPPGPPPVFDPTAPIEQRVEFLESGYLYHQVALGQLDVRTANNQQQINQVRDIAALQVMRINALETTQTGQADLIGALQATQSTQAATIVSLQGTQATQAAGISALQAGQAAQAAGISALQAGQAAQAGRISELQAAQGAFTAGLDTVFDLAAQTRRESRRGIAAAVAMGSASMPSAPGRTTYVLNGATFRGEFAIGGSLAHRISRTSAITGGFAYGGGKNNAARIGLAGEF